MFSSPQIAAYRTGSESLATQVTSIERNVDIEEQESLLYKFLKYYYDITISMMKSHVIPILESDTYIMENQFNKQLPDFSKKMEELNRTTFEKVDNIQEFVSLIFRLYKSLEQGIKVYKFADLEQKVLDTLDVLKDFDNVYLGILMKRPEQLSDALNNIRNSEHFEDFETSRVGTLLAFFCLLAYIKEEINDKQKLSKLVEITDKYSTSLEGWIDTIDIMSNPKEAKEIEETEEYYNKISTNE
jgi:hypothetical protein